MKATYQKALRAVRQLLSAAFFVIGGYAVGGGVVENELFAQKEEVIFADIDESLVGDLAIVSENTDYIAYELDGDMNTIEKGQWMNAMKPDIIPIPVIVEESLHVINSTAITIKLFTFNDFKPPDLFIRQRSDWISQIKTGFCDTS